MKFCISPKPASDKYSEQNPLKWDPQNKKEDETKK